MKCDLKLDNKSKHRGLYKFWVNDTEFIFVCADCLKVLVLESWNRKAKQ